jgi:hypothetical protein
MGYIIKAARNHSIRSNAIPDTISRMAAIFLAVIDSAENKCSETEGQRGFEAKAKPNVEKLPPGKDNAAFNGKATTNVKFSEAGDYVLHVTVNDYSGEGGGGFQCCWTTGLVKVSVKP